jgi:hypothetical protein
VSGILQQDTNVRLHLRGMEHCGNWASQEGASASGMFEMHYCTRLGGRVLQRDAGTSYRADGASACASQPCCTWTVTRTPARVVPTFRLPKRGGAEPWITRVISDTL